MASKSGRDEADSPATEQASQWRLKWGSGDQRKRRAALATRDDGQQARQRERSKQARRRR